MICIRGYLGIDVGSISTKVVIIDDDINVIAFLYTRSQGDPIKSVQGGLKVIANQVPNSMTITAVGCTGSARKLLGIISGADIVKNEIIAHAIAANHFIPGVKTVIEIGGQDSKIIIIRDGVAIDFAMNTICAAGTGSFLDHQASRLGIRIEEFGDLALKSKTKVNIAGRCTVFCRERYDS